MPQPNPTALEVLLARASDNPNLITRDAITGDAPHVQPESIDAENRTVEVVFSTGARVTRYEIDWATYTVRKYYEELDLRGARLERLNTVGALLAEHSSRDGWDGRAFDGLIGTVDRAWVADGAGRAIIRFDERERASEVFGLVQRKIVKAISVGYQVHKWDRSQTDPDGTPIRRAIDWEPYELSPVSVPADPGAQIRSLAAAFTLPEEARAQPTNREVHMTTPTPAGNEPAPTDVRNAPPAPPVVVPTIVPTPEEHAWRAGDITRLQQRAEAFGLTAADAIKAMGEHRSLDAATDALQNQAATRNAPRQTPHVQITTDEGDTLRSAVENAVASRANPQATKLTDAGRQYRGMSLMELGRVYVEESQGVRLRSLGKMEMATALMGLNRAAGMQSTSDFPQLLANVASKRLRDTYESAPRLWRLIARQSNVSDFKEKAVVQLAGIPELVKVREGGEYTYAKLSESVEKYSIATYGRVIAITRQALINDDLGAFDRLPSLFGRAAAELENDIVWGTILNNPVMGDGKTLFHTDHGNLAATGGAPSDATFEAAETALGDQKDAANKPLNLSFRYFLGAQKYGPAIKRLLTSVSATKTGDVNIYQNAVDPIIENRLKPETGAAPWFLTVDPGRWDTIEYAYLEGEEGLYTEERVGFEVDGIEVKGRLDFGAKAIDWRGLYKNPGI